MAQNESTQLKITQVRGTVGARWKQRESLRTLGLRCDKETGRTEPFVWVKSSHAPRLTMGTRAARLAAMQLLGIRQGECWQRPLSS